MSKISKVTVENFKRVHKVTIDAGQTTVTICGKNEQGKSSILDAIAVALGGLALSPERPIKDGETKAFVSVKLTDGMVAERRWEMLRDGKIKTKLEVRSGDGRTLEKPQHVLDRLLGSLSFDPEVFSKADKKTRLDLLRSVMKINLSEYDTKAAEIYRLRTEVGRELDAAKAALSDLHDLPTPLPPVDVAELVRKQEAIAADQAERTRILGAADLAKRKRIDREEKVEEARRRLTEAEAILREQIGYLGECVEAEKSANFDAKMAPPEQTSGSLAAEISKATAHNEEQKARARKHEERAAKQKLFDELDGDYKQKTADLQKIDEEKKAIIAAAKFPVEGLGFSEDDVTYNGTPFGDCSSAARIRVATAMGLALNPELRIIQIRNASLLDEDSMAIINDLAEKSDAQVWFEVVGKTPGGILIQDGEVADG